MNKPVFYILILLMLVIIFGCNSNPTKSSGKLILDEQSTLIKTDSTPRKEEINIALVMKTLTNPFFIDMEKGARKAGAELGVNLIVKTGSQETSIQQQIDIIEELIGDKVDAIVIAPGHSVDLIPVLKKAQDNNIQIVNIDNRLDLEVSRQLGLVDVPFISIDNRKWAYVSAKYISDMITEPTKVAIIEGIIGSNNSEMRKKGALQAFEENEYAQVVSVQSADWKIDEAFHVTDKIMKQNPEVGAIFCANDMMALGAAEYLQSINRLDVSIAGFDALDETKNAIKQNKIRVTINQKADVQGYTGVLYAMKLIKREKVPLETYIEAEVVDVDKLK